MLFGYNQSCFQGLIEVKNSAKTPQDSSRVYVKGKSVTFSDEEYQKRSRSTVLRTGLPSFDSKPKFPNL